MDTINTPDLAGRPLDDHSLQNAAERLLKKSEKTPPEQEPEQQLEEGEPESEDEVEDEGEESPADQEPEGEPEEEGEEEGELVFTVKLDGEDYEVNAEELKAGYQRQKDYTKKTQQLAEQRKSYESKLSEVTAFQEDFVQKATLANELLNRDLKKFQSVDWEGLKAKDPVAYVQKMIEMQDVRNSQAELKAEAQRVFEYNQKIQQDSHQQYLESERKTMLDLFPEWKAPEKASSHQAKIVAYSKTLGYTDQEMSEITRAKDLLVLDKARLYDEQQKLKNGITEKVKPTMRKLVKSKGKGSPKAAMIRDRQESRDRLRSSGSIRDAAAIMFEMRNSKVITKPR